MNLIGRFIQVMYQFIYVAKIEWFHLRISYIYLNSR